MSKSLGRLKQIADMFPRVTKFVDSRKPVEVIVTRADCKAGKKKDATSCAMAKAVKRQFNADGVIIRVGASYIIKGKTAVRFMTPASVGREITSFDRHNDFAEGVYRLSAVPKCRMFGRRDSGGKTRHPGTKSKMIVHRNTAGIRVWEN